MQLIRNYILLLFMSLEILVPIVMKDQLTLSYKVRLKIHCIQTPQSFLNKEQSQLH